jgi:hypothetical protein
MIRLSRIADALKARLYEAREPDDDQGPWIPCSACLRERAAVEDSRQSWRTVGRGMCWTCFDYLIGLYLSGHAAYARRLDTLAELYRLGRLLGRSPKPRDWQ